MTIVAREKTNKTKQKNQLAIMMPNKCCATETAGRKEDGVLRPEGGDQRMHGLTPPASIHADEAEMQPESAGQRDDGDTRPVRRRLRKWGAKPRPDRTENITIRRDRQAEGGDGAPCLSG